MSSDFTEATEDSQGGQWCTGETEGESSIEMASQIFLPDFVQAPARLQSIHCDHALYHRERKKNASH